MKKTTPSGPTPATGTQDHPVNAGFSGPDALGLLNDVPPLFGMGIAAAPLVALNGVEAPKLGIAGPQSPKTHG